MFSLSASIDMLVKQVELLTARLEKVEREGKRQAAPFRKKRKPDPKKPGRKSGEDHGKHHRRAVPEKIDETYQVLCRRAVLNAGTIN